MSEDDRAASVRQRIRRAYPALTDEQWVELVRRVAGIKEGVWDWRRGESIRDRLPPGTPTAPSWTAKGVP
jgi:hypothetical protein